MILNTLTQKFDANLDFHGAESNNLYDSILNLELSHGCQTFAFKMALLVEADDKLALMSRVEYALDIIRANKYD